MVQYPSLLNILSQHLGGNNARLKVLSDLIICLLKARSVNLVHLATHSQLSTPQTSIYRRFQRFFSQWDFPELLLAKYILSRLSIPKPKNGYVLSIDRTNWQYGQKHINILTIGIVIGKVAVPLVWSTLPQTSKRGNSNTTLRIDLLSKLLKVLPAKEINFIAMDREFHGKKWLAWLDENQLTFVLRIRANSIVDKYLAREHRRSKREPQAIFGMELYFGVKHVNSQRTDALYVVSNHLKPKKALNAYQQRWGIEVLFGHFKKKGLNLEDTHLTQADKIDRLVALATLSLLFSFSWALLLKKHLKLPQYYLRKSAFRLGLESIVKVINSQQFEDLIKILTSPKPQSRHIKSIFVV